MAAVTDHEIRLLRPDEYRAAADVFRAALHVPPVSDEDAEYLPRTHQPERAYGAFEGDRVIGTTRSFDSRLVVPGGGSVPLTAVTSVGVRADRTRRGVLSELLRAQLGAAARRGDTAASLHASEGLIYGRFGFGVATRAQTTRVVRARARFVTSAPDGGEVELLDPHRERDRMAEIHRSLGLARPGAMSRPEAWWVGIGRMLRRESGPFATVVHSGESGPDGLATYRVERAPGESPAVLRIEDMQASSVAAASALWRFLLSVDLVDEVAARARPLDEPLDVMLTDPRACGVEAVRDETWLRLLDVPSALAARTYGPGRPVVVEVTDPLLERNSGRYAVSADGAEATGTGPQLRLGVDALAMLYLGDRTATALADAGRVEVLDPAALGEADRLFTTLVSPWCGTFF